MAFQRGDLVLIPFPFTDLSAAKTRPALVISSELYHRARTELLLAYVSSQVSKAHPILDYLLADWSTAGLPKPSFVRPKVAALEPSMVVHKIGQLSARDLFEVDRRLRQAMALVPTSLVDVVTQIDISAQPATLVQALAEKSLAAIVAFEKAHVADVDLGRLRDLLPE